ncbi:hypothetical protein P4H42_07710 [Paenibacillus macerans]|uniref:hypothetical protein n=1 Tax=Paenibacillus macerans TaxID=44252 RepID=UPI002DB9636A|nr:hypothetical protein [Paenibacillus macerans]MEC0329507.1 hypothetical protein [Paenibacillus macerans]
MGRKTAPVLSEGRIGRTVEERLKNDRENGWKKDGLMEPTAKVQLKKAKTWLPEPRERGPAKYKGNKGRYSGGIRPFERNRYNLCRYFFE